MDTRDWTPEQIREAADLIGSYLNPNIKYNEVDGDLIKLAKAGWFDVVVHGCNCQCVQGAGLAPQMVKAFGTDKFPMEAPEFRGDINKLGTIDYCGMYVRSDGRIFPDLIGNVPEKWSYIVVNAYTQFDFGSQNGVPVDYEAITLCMRKMNNIFAGKHIGLPKIGAGLAGGDWERIKKIIRQELCDCTVTVVNYKK